MREILALAGKDLRLLLRDKVGFFFTFFFPVLYATFFGSIFSGFSGGGRGRMEIAVVDEDGSEESRRFTKELSDGKELAVRTIPRAEAANLVRTGKITAYIALPQGFGEARGQFFGGEGVRLQMGVDPARQAEAGILEGLLTRQLYEGFGEMFSRPEVAQDQLRRSKASIEEDEAIDPISRALLVKFFGSLDSLLADMPLRPAADGDQGSWQPVRIEHQPITRNEARPKNAYEISFPQAIMWGVMGCAAAFGISLVVERTKGTLVRLQMAPVSRSQILGGKAVACLATTIGVMAALLTLGVLVFGVRPDSPLLLAMAILCVSIGFVGIMMLLSVLGKTEQAAGGIGWAILTVMAMLGGGMVPQIAMPEFMKSISHVSPVKWAIQSLEGAIWRDYSFVEMLTPCGVMLAVGAVGFALGVRAFRWQ